MTEIRFPVFVSPRASIIILAWRQEGHLVNCLRALRASLSREIPYEIVLLANGSPQRLVDRVRRLTEGVTLVQVSANLGFSGGCNLAVETSRGEYVVLLNDDTAIEPGWLEWLVATADAHPSAGAVGSLILFPDGRIQEAGSIIWADGSTAPVGRGSSE